ncbi:MAG: hypothetical protein WBV59_10280 [Anaerolineae bacterium]
MPSNGLIGGLPHDRNLHYSLFFTNRVSKLATLALAADDLLSGWSQHVVFLDLRRVGKTLMCQE